MKKVSLDKGPDRGFAASGIITKRTGGLGRSPGKKRICEHNKVSQTSDMAESLVVYIQKIEVEQKCIEQRKNSRMHQFQKRGTTRTKV